MNLNLICLFSLVVHVHSFMSVFPNRADHIFSHSLLKLSKISSDVNDHQLLTIDSLLQDIHDSGYEFRIVVIGTGAILETTAPLGPIKKSSTSPKTGERLVTFASEDKSFEFHVKVNHVKKIVLTQVRKPLEGEDKLLQICRFLNDDGGSICSLIMASKTPESIEWFHELKDRYCQKPEVDIHF